MPVSGSLKHQAGAANLVEQVRGKSSTFFFFFFPMTDKIAFSLFLLNFFVSISERKRIFTFVLQLLIFFMK